MRIVAFVLLGLIASVALVGGTLPVAAHEPPTTDRVVLRALVEQARMARPDGVTVNFEVQEDDGLQVSGSQKWTVSWGRAGARMGTFASPRDPVPGAETGWQFDATSREAMQWGLAGVRVSRDPQAVQVGELIAPYEFFLGEFVMEGALSLPRQKRDLLALLEDPSAVVLPQTEIVSGEECVVVELDLRDPDGVRGYAMRGYYAIGLGYPQVKFEIVRGDGGLIGRWTSSQFWSLSPGSSALPVNGVYECWDGSGHLNSVLRMTVASFPDGRPEITAGMQLQSASAMPPGTWIQDVDNGKRYQVASDHAARAHEYLSAHPAVRPSDSWMLLAVISLSAVGVATIAFIVGASSSRRSAAAARV
jgi:hypothetical protein